jgi:hypothetical protein
LTRHGSNATRDLAVERTAVFYWRLLMYAIFTALLALTTVVFDYAKVRAGGRDRREHGRSADRSHAIHGAVSRRVVGVFVVNALLFSLVVGDVGVVARRRRRIGAVAVDGRRRAQWYILARLVVKLQVMASETARLPAVAGALGIHGRAAQCAAAAAGLPSAAA